MILQMLLTPTTLQVIVLHASPMRTDLFSCKNYLFIFHTGLRSYHEDQDIEVIFDCDMTNADIGLINKIRQYLNRAFEKDVRQRDLDEGNNRGSLRISVEAELIEIQDMIKYYLDELLHVRERFHVQKQSFRDEYKWGQLQIPNPNVKFLGNIKKLNENDSLIFKYVERIDLDSLDEEISEINYHLSKLRRLAASSKDHFGK